MRVHHIAVAVVVAVSIVGLGLEVTPHVFAGRVAPGVMLGRQPLVGIPTSVLEGVVARYEQDLQAQTVQIVLKEKTIERSLKSLGVSLNREATVEAIRAAHAGVSLLTPRVIIPQFLLNQADITALAQAEFADLIALPTNATLTLTPGGALVVTPSATGETIDLTSFGEELKWRARHSDWRSPIELAVVSAPASVHEGETTQARDLAQELLRQGLPISDGENEWVIQPYTLARLLRFVPIEDSAKPGNEILGLTVDAAETGQYLTTTIAPEVNQPPIDARFERVDNQVTQFAVPEPGKNLNIEASVASIQQSLRTPPVAGRLALVVVDITQPAVQDTSDIDALGINTLLATGTSDFAGSPGNRIHNILEGTKRYHGLLLTAGQEFSFNEFLGPVDGDHGFKPELVIKKNVTIPEFGGGLCQVSTTIFRAATHAGLKITERRNHAYAVRYYGLPGFDATIYPPYTDLRFTNNTPGYVLIQTRVEGTKLTFELWGTSDGREVLVDGPHPYGRTPSGAVKATLTQKVTKDGELIIDDAFHSRYQSPDLFPKASANLAGTSTNATNQPSAPPAGGPTPTAVPSPPIRPAGPPSPT